MIEQRRRKAELRYLARARRNMLTREERSHLTSCIIDGFVSQPFFRDKLLFFIYCSHASEVETSDLIHYCLQSGKSICVPLTVPDPCCLHAISITDPVCEIAPGYRGIPEPCFSDAGERKVNPLAIDVAVIPGLAFDRFGYRLGYGGGYYDRFLASEAPQAMRIGLAFSVQLLDILPVESHDVPLDMLITEQEILTWS